MPKPTDLPVWATDASYPAGSDPWSGEPTKVEPLSGEQALGWEPGKKPAAEWMNWKDNLVYQWLAWLDGIALADGIWRHGTRTISVPFQAQGFDASVNVAATIPNTTDGWIAPIPGLIVGQRIVGARAFVVADTPTSELELVLGRHVVTLGAIPTGSYSDVAVSAPSVNAGTDVQQLTLSGLSVDVEALRSYYLVTRLASGATATNTLWGLELDVSQP